MTFQELQIMQPIFEFHEKYVKPAKSEFIANHPYAKKVDNNSYKDIYISKELSLLYYELFGFQISKMEQELKSKNMLQTFLPEIQQLKKETDSLVSWTNQHSVSFNEASSLPVEKLLTYNTFDKKYLYFSFLQMAQTYLPPSLVKLIDYFLQNKCSIYDITYLENKIFSLQETVFKLQKSDNVVLEIR